MTTRTQSAPLLDLLGCAPELRALVLGQLLPAAVPDLLQLRAACVTTSHMVEELLLDPERIELLHRQLPCKIHEPHSSRLIKYDDH
eukprot:SAG31_NODE_3244_length_4500_cov_2.174960_5_plen_86_part_00